MSDGVFWATGGLCENEDDIDMVFDIFTDDELYELFGLNLTNRGEQ